MNITDVKWIPCEKGFRAQVGMIIKCDQGSMHLIGDAAVSRSPADVYVDGCGCCSHDIRPVQQWAWIIKGMVTHHQIEVQENGRYVGHIEIPYDCDVKIALKTMQRDTYWISKKYDHAKKIIFVTNKVINFVLD